MRPVLRDVSAGAFFLGASLAAAAEKSMVTIWVVNNKGWKGIDQVAQEYALKSGMKVKVQHFDDATKPFEEAMSAGKGPDIWIWAHDRLGDWIKRGWMPPATPDTTLKQDTVAVACDGFT